AAGADPAAGVLEEADVYVSPRALGPAAPAAKAELAEAADRFGDAGQPVKLAIVADPAGAPSMLVYAAPPPPVKLATPAPPAGAPSLLVYARRLAGDVASGETLVVTAPGRPVIA